MVNHNKMLKMGAGTLVAGSLVAAAVASAQVPAPRRATSRLLIGFKAGVRPEQSNSLVAAVGGRTGGTLRGARGVRVQAVEVGSFETARRALLRRPEVAFVEEDKVVAPAAVPNDPQYATAWHLAKISAPAAWDVTTGDSSVTIAILDSGVDPTHPDLAAKLVPGWNIFDNNSNTSDPYGHGTAVAGTAAAITNNATGVAAPGWDCSVMPVRISDTAGYSTYSLMADGLVWAADHGAKVANISYIASGSATVQVAAQYFESKGGVVVASGGNDGIYDSTPNNPDILTVGGTLSSDARASWSSYGPVIDMVAPGYNIKTTKKGSLYSTYSGTSYSAPLVAAGAALVLSANPALTPTQVADILVQTADDLGTPGPDIEYGSGRLNLAAAVTAATELLVEVDNLAPTVQFTAPAGGATLSGTAAVQVDAADNVGVTSVALAVDGQPYDALSTAPYTFSLDTTALAEGQHTLTATAADAAGNVGTTQVTVTVDQPDVTAPTVSFTAPAANAAVTGTVSIEVAAADDESVPTVTLTCNGVSLGTVGAAPYTFSWDTSSYADGPATLTATATDAAGNTAAQELTLTVQHPDTTAPTVAITAPTAGADVTGTVTVSVNASDNSGAASVSLTAGAASLGTAGAAPYTFQWDTSALANGSVTLTATATDAAGNQSTHQVTVNVQHPDTTAPTVSITAPASGATVSGTVTVSVNAADNVGVATVSVTAGSTSLGTLTAAPYSFAWNTTGAANGSTVLTATATDAAGNQSTHQVTVTVNNGDTEAPAITITAPTNNSTVRDTPVQVRVTATDNVAVVRVELLVDGVLDGSSTNSPFNLTWNPKKVARGAHTLRCLAYDAAGNVGYSQILQVTRQ